MINGMITHFEWLLTWASQQISTIIEHFEVSAGNGQDKFCHIGETGKAEKNYHMSGKRMYQNTQRIKTRRNSRTWRRSAITRGYYRGDIIWNAINLDVKNSQVDSWPRGRLDKPKSDVADRLTCSHGKTGRARAMLGMYSLAPRK